jgi:hypothetical protein
MDKNDHDLLVTLSTKMDQLCKVNTKSEGTNKEAHDAILKQIDKNHEKTDQWVSAVHDRIDDQLKTKTNQVSICNARFVQSKVFYWIIGFVVFGLFSAWGTIAVFDTRIDKVEVKLERVHPTPIH